MQKTEKILIRSIRSIRSICSIRSMRFYSFNSRTTQQENNSNQIHDLFRVVLFFVSGRLSTSLTKEIITLFVRQ